MSINVNDKNLGHATAYAYYKAGGGTMTEAEFTEFMADFGTASQTAVEAAQAALASETAARNASTTATNKASEATTAATTATTKAGEASTSASTATSAKDTAVSASQTATTKATEATTAAATATSAATTATTAKDDAVSAKTAAQTAQTGAETAAASVSASAAQIATNAEDISQLKSEITDKSDTADLLKAFPTDTASGSVASFADGANVSVKSLIVNIDPVQSGSGDPSPTNVRPISGWSEVNVEHAGKNLIDTNNFTAGVMNDKGIVSVQNVAINSKGNGKVNWTSSSAWRGVTTDYVDIRSGCTYMFSLAATPSFIIYAWFTRDKSFISRGVSASNSQVSITAPDGAMYLRVSIQQEEAGTYVYTSIQLELGSTATPYEPYSGQSINIALGQTVYGGTLDVAEGELVIDSAMADLGTLEWFRTTSYVNPVLYADIDGHAQKSDELAICSVYPYVGTFGYAQQFAGTVSDKVVGINYNNKQLFIRDDSYTDATAFKTAVKGQQLVYELATPLTVHLTPHEVTALLGSNNIWADTGDSTVEYRADPTLYIQRLTVPDADMIADANITSGSYFMVGNTLYKATSNIASGATISPNVNCTRKSLSEALNELNA